MIFLVFIFIAWMLYFLWTMYKTDENPRWKNFLSWGLFVIVTLVLLGTYPLFL